MLICSPDRLLVLVEAGPGIGAQPAGVVLAVAHVDAVVGQPLRARCARRCRWARWRPAGPAWPAGRRWPGPPPRPEPRCWATARPWAARPAGRRWPCRWVRPAGRTPGWPACPAGGWTAPQTYTTIHMPRMKTHVVMTATWARRGRRRTGSAGAASAPEIGQIGGIDGPGRWRRPWPPSVTACGPRTASRPRSELTGVGRGSERDPVSDAILDDLAARKLVADSTDPDELRRAPGRGPDHPLRRLRSHRRQPARRQPGAAAAAAPLPGGRSPAHRGVRRRHRHDRRSRRSLRGAQPARRRHPRPQPGRHPGPAGPVRRPDAARRPAGRQPHLDPAARACSTSCATWAST